MEEIIIRDGIRPLRFTGTLLARESTESNVSLRWLELELYRVGKGKLTGTYLLHRVGQSVVYHAPEACGYGKATDWKNVPDDAEPCPVCKPVAGAEAEVWMESAWSKVIRCADAHKVEEALLMKGKSGLFLSQPATNLLEKASRTDEKIREMMLKIEDL
jgi:hypothetical protein